MCISPIASALVIGSIVVVNVTPITFFTKLAKSHISAQFLVIVCVLEWYTYFETAQVLFSLCFR